MLKKGLSICLLLLLFGVSYGQNRDTANLNNPAIVKLDGYIDNYLMLTPPDIDSLITACDYLISFSKDPLIKSHITGYLFEKFYYSSFMGMESVAIHIAKNYYLNKTVRLPEKFDSNALQLYVDFNESSLLGMNAPPLLLKDLQNKTVALRDVEASRTLIYFFDDQCQVCKKELPGLKEIVERYKPGGLKVYAVYTQSNKENFKSFVKKEFGGSKIGENWVFTWDPTYESNFQKLYNVMKTPQMFLLDKQKIIIGRNLNNEALLQLLTIGSYKKN